MMELQASINLPEETYIASLKVPQVDGNIRFSVGDEEGSLFLFKEGEDQEPTKLQIQGDSCVVDHEWVNKNHVLHTDCRHVKLFDLEKGVEVAKFIGHEKEVLALKSDKDSHFFVSSGDDASVLAWDYRFKKPFSFILAHSNTVTSIDLSQDSTLILTSSSEGYWYFQLSVLQSNPTSRSWDVHDGICLGNASLFGTPPVSHAKFGPNAKAVFMATLDNTLHLYDRHEERTLMTYKGHSNSQFLVEFDLLQDPDTGLTTDIAIGSENGQVHLYNIEEGSPSCSLELDTGKNTLDLVEAAASRPNGAPSFYVAGRGLETVYLLQKSMKFVNQPGALLLLLSFILKRCYHSPNTYHHFSFT